MLEPISYIGIKIIYGGKARVWLYRCSYCNKLVERRPVDAVRVKSCGCMTGKFGAIKNTKHNGCNTPLYDIWSNMKSRCYNPNNQRYKRYGARGIIVCDEWINNFGTFQKWALENGYKKGLQIDRINNDLNYSPDNCRFVPLIINVRNKNNIKVTPEVALQVKADYQSGKYTHRSLGKKYNISHAYAGNIVRGQSCIPYPLG